jgi:hypothetical protein
MMSMMQRKEEVHRVAMALPADRRRSHQIVPWL